MPSKILLSPSETKLKKALGDDAITSLLCEEKGADILIYSPQGLMKIQRKSIPGDFLSSMTDGRFATSLPLLVKDCSFCRVLCEGEFKYWPDGTVFIGMSKDKKRIPSYYRREHIDGMLNDIEFIYGIQIRWTKDIQGTVLYIRSVQRFLDEKTHVGLFTRPKAKGTWAVPSKRDIHLWLLQSFNGIGARTASKIIDTFGRAPLDWTCTPEELASAANVQLAKAIEWMDCLKSIEERQQRGNWLGSNIKHVAKDKTVDNKVDFMSMKMMLRKCSKD